MEPRDLAANYIVTGDAQAFVRGMLWHWGRRHPILVHLYLGVLYLRVGVWVLILGLVMIPTLYTLAVAIALLPAVLMIRIVLKAFVRLIARQCEQLTFDQPPAQSPASSHTRDDYQGLAYSAGLRGSLESLVTRFPILG